MKQAYCKRKRFSTHLLLLCISILFSAACFSQQIDFCVGTGFTDEDLALPALKDTGISRGTMDPSKTWPAGTVLKLKFLNGDTAMQYKVAHYAQEWPLHANISFEFVKKGNAEIRIEFDSLKGNYSTTGTDAVNQSPNKATTHFDFTNTSKEETIKRHVLHEFGHILGLLHENSSPFADIDWEKDSVYNYYKRSQGWNKKQVDENVFFVYGRSYTNGMFDPKSIMCYNIPPEFTKTKRKITGVNMELSEGDKAMIRQMYPADSTGNSNDGPKVNYALSPKYESEKNMLIIKPIFKLVNGNGYLFKIGAYLFDEKEKPLKDASGNNRSKDGQIATMAKIQPCCKEIFVGDKSGNQISLSLPLSALPVKKGKNHFKCQLVIWSSTTKIYCSPKYELEFISQ